MSAQAATRAPEPRGLRTRRLTLRLPSAEGDLFYAGVLGLVLAWVAVRANGGLRVGNTTAVEIVVDLVAGVVAVVAVLAVPNLRRRAPGMTAAIVFGLFVVASMISTVWSVDPSGSWIEANRIITYLAVFLIGMALARLAPHRWVAVTGGITIACVLVSAYALAHKTFPAQLDAAEKYARLEQPFGYWNAVGLMAAMGVPGCLWLGARRAGHAALNAFAYPATMLLLVVILLAYSRGALLALAVGCAFWFGFTPLRLRGVAVLGTAAVGAAAIIAWTFSQHALTQDKVDIALRSGAGHELLVAVLLGLLVELLAGLAIGFAMSRTVVSARRRRWAGIAVLACLALVPIGVAGKLATSDRGLTGSISHDWNQLTNPNATTPPNDPGRLTAVGSVRARYWNEALKIFKDHPIAGVGPGGYATARLRYRNDDLAVQHAHGYIVQVLADRGLLGLILSLAALGALGIAAAQATGLRRGARAHAAEGRGSVTTPERVGLLTLASVIVIFGVHSFVDWSWFIPGVAIPPLLAGGWLAARGPLELPERAPQRLLARAGAGLRNQPRAIAAAVAAALALSAAWTAWQPQRSIDASNAALDAAASGNIPKARKLAQRAHDRDPLSIEPYLDQGAIENKAGNRAGALAAYERAVKLQPANPATWTRLADYQLNALHRPADAKKTLSAALFLDPRSFEGIALIVQANRELEKSKP